VRRLQVRFFGTLAVLLAVGSPGSAAPLSDVLHLADGSVVTGSIVEEEPGRSYTVETVEGERVVCRVERVQRIEKRLEPAEAAIQQRSIVFLTDGVVFKGIIVERVPGGPVVLELASGRLLHLAAEEIVKIIAEPVAGGVAKERPLAPAATRRTMIEFEIDLVQKQVTEKQKSLEAAASGTDTRAGLESEIARLRQELESLSAEREHAREEAAQEEGEAREHERQFGEIASGLREAREEIAKRVESCSVPELRNRMRESLAEIDQKVEEIVQRTEVIVRVADPDPRLVPLQQAECRNEIQGLVANRLWDVPSYREQFARASTGLPVKERQQFYRENRQTVGTTRLLNLIPMLSIGSWIQGDFLGAGIGMASTIGGAALLLFTLGPFGAATQTIGIVLVSAGYLYSVMVAPDTFVSDNNKRLAKALGLRPGGGAP
jgi:hypothetical protein